MTPEEEARARILLAYREDVAQATERAARALEDLEPIPLSGEESIALEALRLLVQRGVIGE